MNIEYEEGDWLCLYRNNRLDIVEIRYVRLGRTGQQLIYTDYGQVDPDSILEVRRLAEYIKGDEESKGS